MENTSLKQASAQDQQTVWTIWHACAMEESTCWQDDYPTPAILSDDLTHGWLYLLLWEGHPVGSVTLALDDVLRGQGYPFAPCVAPLLLTRLCVEPARWRRGLGKRLLSLAEAQAAQLGADALHLLCDVRNNPATALFTSSGYTRVCIATLWGDHFTVFEKRLCPSPQL